MKEQKSTVPNHKRTGRKLTQLDGKTEDQPERLIRSSQSEKDQFQTILNNRIRDHLIQYISQELYLIPDEIDITQNIRDYGANSITILQMLRNIENRFEIKITGREMMDLQTISSISTYLANKIALSKQPKDTKNQTHRSEAKNQSPNEIPSLKSPLSEGQKGLWMLQKTSPNMSAYNVPICFRIGRDLELTKFHQACHFLLEQYPILNTIIGEEKGVPYQIIKIGQPMFFETEDISTYNLEDVIPYLRNKLKIPFQLEQGPLMRVHHFTCPKEHIVLINVHHILFDGISSSLLITKLFDIYHALLQNKVPEVIPSTTNYGDFVKWEQVMLASEAGEEHLAYWKQQLSGTLPVMELPTDHPRSSTPSFEGQILSRLLSPELSNQIKTFADSMHINRSVMFLGIFKVVLHRYTNQEDLIIGLPTFGRPQERFNSIIGYFINMLPIRSQVIGSSSFSDYFRKLQFSFIDGLDHAEYPFPALVRALNVPRIPGISPVFQVIFLYQNFIQAQIPQYFQGDGSKQPSFEFIEEVNQEGEYELELEVLEQNDTFRLNFKYNPLLFEEDTIARMAEHYLNLTSEVMKDPNTALDSYLFLSQAETQKLLIDWNATETNYPKEKCIHLLFEEQVQKNPDAVAVVFEDYTLTYQELDQKSTQLALFLQRQGVKPDCLVGICVERHWEMLVGLLGILKAGGAYIPLDPEYPADRLEYMLENSKVPILLTQARLMPKIANLLRDNLKVVALDQDWTKIQAETKTGTLQREVHGEHLAYVLYTSGSTGRPKGVMIPHRALTNFLISMSQKPGLNSRDKLLAVTTFCFDIAGLELYLPLINGAQVCICSSETAKDVEKLKQEIQKYHPTVMQATPVTWTMLFLTGWQNEERVKILCGGEALSENLKQSFMDNQCELWNMFGPTETTIWSTVELIIKEEPITLGKPIANTRIYIIDRNLNPTPIGIPGELCIAGDGLARGYLHQSELTAEKFIDNPFEPGTKLYRTGDLARWTTAGKIDFLGRIDHQVKIRGFRIELGEIESQLLAHPEIQDCAVIVKEKADYKQLLGFYIAKKPLTQKELRDFLSPKLPEYMVPASFIALDKMPLTPNGKHDRKTLNNHPVIIQRTATIDEKPHYEIEAKVLGIWKDVLHRNEIGLEEGFFDVGGDSFLAVTVAHRIKEDLHCDFSVTELFQYANIQEISQYLSKRENVVVSSLPDSMKPKRLEEQRILNITAPAQPSYPDYYQDSVAIIGISCQFPGAKNYLEFWNNLRAAKESVKFFSKDELVNLKLPKEMIENPNFVPIQATIEDRDLFDPGFFNISPRDVEYMDPQFRLLLLHSWKAVEDAGYIPKQIPETGVFMTAGNNLYTALLSNFKGDSAETDDSERYVSWLLSQGGTIPTMISHKLGFQGPSFFVHSNCSSSLVGINSAVQSIRTGESKFALVGAASISCLVNIGYIYEKGLNFSSDGHLKAFDASADGMVDGEGVAVIVLKKAIDAVCDGDNIYAILRGIGINNDGADKVGFYAPSVKGQAAVVRKVLDGTKIDPESIIYVEAHGTGTRLGDPIEIAALTETYRQFTTKKGYCGIGSVKTNIGHLDTAAGLAGCIKVALSLHYSEIPPSLNYKEPNPDIDLQNSPFYVVDKILKLNEQKTPYRAALSSFGIGGTNTHAIFEQYVNTGETEWKQDSYIIPLSARNEERLKVYVQEWLNFLNLNQVQSKLDLNRLAYTLQVGREAMEARLAFIVGDTGELIQKLTEYLGGNEKNSGCFIGMINQPQAQVQLLEKEEDFQEIIHKWYQKGLLGKIAEFWAGGFQINWEIIYSEPKPRRCSLPTYPFAGERYRLPEFNGRNTKLTKDSTNIDFIHPLLQLNTSDLAEQRYSSTFTGGEFFLADYIFRGQKVLPGVVYLEMARAAVATATGFLEDKTRMITLKNIVWLRTVGVGEEPAQIHIGLFPEESGEITFEVYSLGETDEAEAVIYCQGIATLLELPEVAVLDLKSLQIECNEWKLPDAELSGRFKEAGIEYGTRLQAIEAIYVGPGIVLAKLKLPLSIADTEAEFGLHPSMMEAALQAMIGMEAPKSGSMTTPRLYLPFALQELEVFKTTTSNMWALLRNSDGSIEDKNKKFNIDLCDDQGNICVRIKGLEIKTAMDNNDEAITTIDPQEPYQIMSFEEVWREAALPKASPVPLKTIVCFLSNPDYQQEIIEAFTTSGQQTKLIYITQGSKQPGNYHVKRNDRNSYEMTFRSIGKKYGDIDSVLYLWTIEERDCIEDYSCIVHILQAMKVAGIRPKRFLLAANYEKYNVESCYPESWIGFERSLGMILPNTKIAMIYKKTGANQKLAMKDWGEKLRTELYNSELQSVLYQGEKRYIYQIQPLTIPVGKSVLKPGGTYLITGGCGGLGFIMAKYIAQKHPVNLVLTGRSAIDAEKEKQIKLLEGMGSQVIYLQSDVCDSGSMTKGIKQARKRFEKIDGVIHAAGIDGVQSIFEKGMVEFKKVIDPKIKGTLVLDEVTKDEPLEFICYFSSSAAILGDFGSCDYAVGNRFLMAYANYRNRQTSLGNLRGKALTINWPLWKDGGMGFGNDQNTKMYLKTSGQRALETEEGLALLEQILGQTGGPYLIIAGQPSRVNRFLGLVNRLETPVNNLNNPMKRNRLEMAGLSVEQCLEWDLKELVSKLLKISRDKIEWDKNLADFGFDSISLAQLANQLTDFYGVEITPAVFFGYSTLEKLTQYFLSEQREVIQNFYRQDAIDLKSPESGSVPFNAFPAKNRQRRQKSRFVVKNEHRGPMEPVAIIGMSGRFPGARNIEELWEILCKGENAVGEIPKERFDWQLYYGDIAEPGKTNCKWCGCIPGVSEFEPLFFEISPKEAETMDPRQRLLLQEAWRALEDAGYGSKQIKNQKIGMFVGAEQGDYQFLTTGASEVTANSNAILAARLAYFLNLNGPVMAIDTACSSGLVSAHQAILSLRSGECDTAIVAGVNLMLTPAAFIEMGQAGMLSGDGKCFTFDKRANGLVPGEAVAVIVLKCLSRAEADGDPIYAVIKGSGINYDGKTNGITAPSGVSQTALLKEVYERHHINPEEIEYIIPHGTGTKLGDSVEINTLFDTFKDYTKKEGYCALTSTKTNFGHTLAPAGIVSLISLVQALRYETIPASLHCEQENDYIDWKESPFYVNKQNKPWPETNKNRTGAVSAFGMSGTNAHMVVQSYSEDEKDTFGVRAPYYLLAFSAETPESLTEKIRDMIKFFQNREIPPSDLARISYTLLEGRQHFQYRCAVVVQDRENAIYILKQLEKNEKLPNVFQGKVPRNFTETKALGQYGQELLKTILTLWDNPAKYQETLLALADLYCQGYEIEWRQLYNVAKMQRIHLPTYPFIREEYWVEQGKPENIFDLNTLHDTPQIDRTVSKTFYDQLLDEVMTGRIDTGLAVLKTKQRIRILS